MIYKDSIKTDSTPYVTWILIAINAIILVLMLVMPSLIEKTYNTLGLIPAQLGFVTFYTLFTSMFLHGGIGHVFGNCLYLYIFGDNIEDSLGKLNYLFFYLICGVIAGGLHVFTNLNSTIITIGASGAISGMLGAYFRLYSDSELSVVWFLAFQPVTFKVPSKLFLIFWIVMQLFYGLTGLSPGVAIWAHIGGFAAGFFGIKILIHKSQRKGTVDKEDLRWMT